MNKVLSIIVFIVISFDTIAQVGSKESILENLDTVESLLYSEPEQAKKLLDSVYNVLETGKIEHLYSYIYNTYGDVYFIDGNYEVSLEYFGKAKDYSEEFNNLPELATSLYSYGVNYVKLDKFNLAIKNFNQALEIREKTDDLEGVSSIYNELGHINFLKNDINKAIEFLEKCVEIDRQNNDKNGLGYSYSNLGAFYLNKNEIDLALEYQEKALELRLSTGNEQLIARTYNNLANIYSVNNDFDRAVKYYLKSLEIKKKYNNQYEIAVTLNNIGDTYLDYLGNEHQAYMYLKQSEKILDSLPATLNTYDNKLYLSKMYEKMDSANLAITYLKEYYELRDSIRVYKNDKPLEDNGVELNRKIEKMNWWKLYSIISTLVFTLGLVVLIVFKKKK